MSTTTPTYAAVVAGGNSPHSRDSRLPRNFPANERSALLGRQLPRISEDGAYAAEDDSGQTQDDAVVARVRRTIRAGKRRNSLPLYAYDGSIQHPGSFGSVLGVLLYLVVVVMLVGGAMLVRSGSEFRLLTSGAKPAYMHIVGQKTDTYPDPLTSP